MTFNDEQYKIADTQARSMLISLFDEGTFEEIDAYAKSKDGKTQVICGYGSVYGTPAYAFSQDITADGGAVSKAQGEKIKKVYDLAAKTGAPIVGIYDSNGMKLNEGFEALSAYGDMLKLSNNISGVVPQIAVISGSCVGTCALIAEAADIVIISKDSDFYLTAPSEVTAEDCLAAGIASIMADSTEQAIETAKDVISKLPMNNLSPAPVNEFSDDVSFLSKSCDIIRGNTKETVIAIADVASVVELCETFGTAAHTSIATIAGSSVGFIAFNGQVIDSDTCEKACRFIRFCDAFNLPMITLVNAASFKADDASILRYASRLSSSYADATAPKISLITGDAVGAAYIALAGRGANADMVFSWKCAVISPMEPNAAVAVMYNDRLANGENREELVKEYMSGEASPLNAASFGQVDDIFTPSQTREKLIAALDMLAGKRTTTLPKKHSVI